MIKPSFVVFGFIFAFSSLIVAQCEQPVEEYGACVENCFTEFSEPYDLGERDECVQEKCVALLNQATECKEKEAETSAAQTIDGKEVLEKEASKAEGFPLLGLIVFLALVGMGVLAYFKFLQKK